MSEKSYWGKTKIVRKRLEDKIIDNTYLGRPLIHSDSSILGGIYPGASERPAVVVDRKYGQLEKLFEKAKQKATIGTKLWKNLILESVYETVKEAIPKMSPKPLYDVLKRKGLPKDGKVALDNFIQAGIGNCVHTSLTCAALLEMFQNEGLISGKISVDRNATQKGGHAWCRYTNSGGEVYILDVANRYIGLLKEATKWPYERPGESR